MLCRTVSRPIVIAGGKQNRQWYPARQCRSNRDTGPTDRRSHIDAQAPKKRGNLIGVRLGELDLLRSVTRCLWRNESNGERLP